MAAQAVKNLPAMQETLCQEDPLEKATAAHSNKSCLANPMDRGPGGLQYMGHKESDTTE